MVPPARSTNGAVALATVPARLTLQNHRISRPGNRQPELWASCPHVRRQRIDDGNPIASAAMIRPSILRRVQTELIADGCPVTPSARYWRRATAIPTDHIVIVVALLNRPLFKIQACTFRANSLR